MTRERRPRPAVKGWKARSILFHRYMTRPESDMRARSLFPDHARHALDAALAVGRLLGFSKKHWRDGDVRPLSVEQVEEARAAVNAALDRMADAIRNPEPVEENADALQAYDRHGLIGLLAIGMVEEACELAEPVARVAQGLTTFDDARREIEDESADVRMYHVMTDDSFGIDINFTTQRKNDETLSRFPEAAEAAFNPPRLDDEVIARSMKSILPNRKVT